MMKNYNLVMDDSTIIALLNLLLADCDDNFWNCLTITGILKAHNKQQIWDDWSKKNTGRFNYRKNCYLWKWCKPIYNINMLVYILRVKYKKEDINYIHYYKKYDPLTVNNFYHNKKEIDERFVSDAFSYDDFLSHDIHIIKSTTGTGKTT